MTRRQYLPARRSRVIALDEARRRRFDRTDPGVYKRTARVPTIRQMSEWTVDDVLSAQDAHERGEYATSGLLWLWMQRNSRLKAVLRKRCGALAALPFHLSPASGEEEASPQELAVASLLERGWYDILPESTLRGIIRQAVGMGSALCRVTWVDDGRYWWPRLQLWPADAYYYRDSDCAWYARTREGGDLRIRPGCGWFLWLPDGPRSFQTGAVLSLALPCLVSSLSDTDWANYNAANAMVIRLAIVPRGATTTSKNTYLDNVEELGRDTSVLLCERNIDGSGFSMEQLPTASGNIDTFERSKAGAEKAITIEILGQEKSTDLGGQGARSAVETLREVEDAIIKADAEGLSTALRSQVLALWCEYNVAGAALAPWPAWEVEQPEAASSAAVSDKAVAEASVALEVALRGSGKSLDRLAYFERAGIPLQDAPVPAPTTPITPEAA